MRRVGTMAAHNNDDGLDVVPEHRLGHARSRRTHIDESRECVNELVPQTTFAHTPVFHAHHHTVSVMDGQEIVYTLSSADSRAPCVACCALLTSTPKTQR